MKWSRVRSWRLARQGRLLRGGFWLLCGLLAGCASGRGQIDEALLAPPPPSAQTEQAAETYRVACPDVLEVAIGRRGQPSTYRLRVGPDGRIDLGPLGTLRVEGQTQLEIGISVARRAGVALDAVAVEVAEYNSQQVYIFGQVKGLQRAVPFRGRETVLELLQRAGGITPGAELNEVYLIRSHVIEGRRPEVFAIDLKAIIVKQDPRTNLVVQPFDHIYIGETRQSCVGKCMPPFLRPFYESMVGMRDDRLTVWEGDRLTSPENSLAR